MAGTGGGREARAALPQPGLGLTSSPCPKPRPPRQPRASAVSPTVSHLAGPAQAVRPPIVGHRVQGMVLTRPLSFHPRELGAQNRQPPPPPSTSARRQPGPPDAALPREPPACPAPARWAPGQLLAAPPDLRPHCLLGSSTNELTVQGWGGTASSTKPPLCSAPPASCSPWVMCATVGPLESGPSVRPAPQGWTGTGT